MANLVEFTTTTPLVTNRLPTRVTQGGPADYRPALSLPTPQEAREQRLRLILRHRLSVSAMLAIPLYVGRLDDWWDEYIACDELEGIALEIQRNLWTSGWFPLKTGVWQGFTFINAAELTANAAVGLGQLLFSKTPLGAIQPKFYASRMFSWLFKALITKMILPILRRLVQRQALRTAGRAILKTSVAIGAWFAVQTAGASTVVTGVGVLINGAMWALDAYLTIDVINELTSMRDSIIEEIVRYTRI